MRARVDCSRSKSKLGVCCCWNNINSSICMAAVNIAYQCLAIALLTLRRPHGVWVVFCLCLASILT